MTSKPKGDPESSSDSEGASGITLTMEDLKKYLGQKLHISDNKPVNRHKIFEEFTIKEVASLITTKKYKNIITLAGAGISTSAGIPDFRSPGSGLYDNLHKYNLPCPEAIFELGFFMDNPKPFFVLAKELYPGSFKPTPCHYFIKLLEQKGMLLRHYTQNIDTLERVAGVSDEKLVEAHGTFFTGHCMECRKKYSLLWMKERIFDDKIPICESCPGVVKPDIVFFGENLPDKFYKCADKDFHNCDLLIIMGSSLVVQPFASLVDRVSDRTPRLLINREKVGQNGGLMALLGIGGGLEFDSPNNTRDVAWIGDCDDGCQLLADELGWGEELKEMVKLEHKLIDEKGADVIHIPIVKESEKASKSEDLSKKESKDLLEAITDDLASLKVEDSTDDSKTNKPGSSETKKSDESPIKKSEGAIKKKSEDSPKKKSKDKTS